ncbi:hypothetical protein M3Y97_00476800 [Aphelenchoides bicaudatus]|nr:hypothetical protein M3Y97_00476800 [Aphelenchoides bicaudatus]
MADPQNCPNLGHQVFLVFYIIVVTFLNLLLLHFIRCRTPDTMKEYKKILITTTVIDFISALMQCSIGIRVALVNDMQTFYFDGPFPLLLGNWEIFKGGRLHFLAMLETFSAASSFGFGIVPFIYRYFAVCWNYSLSFRQLFICMLITSLFALWSSLSYAIMSNEFYEQNSPGLPTDPQCLRPIASWTSAQSESTLYGAWTYWMFRGWFYGLLGILYSYGFVFFCGWRIFINLGRQSFMFVTARAKSLQRQLNFTLALQSLCPLIITGGSLIFLVHRH